MFDRFFAVIKSMHLKDEKVYFLLLYFQRLLRILSTHNIQISSPATKHNRSTPPLPGTYLSSRLPFFTVFLIELAQLLIMVIH